MRAIKSCKDKDRTQYSTFPGPFLLNISEDKILQVDVLLPLRNFEC